MGLDAVVYKNSKSLAKKTGQHVKVHPITGEPLIDRDSKASLPPSDWIACERRLGNLDEITQVRRFVECRLGSSAFLTTRVLYSATHSGDAIGTDDLGILQAEIGVLKRDVDPAYARFLDDMEALILAGIAERNPIVFV